jgi:PAS domain S-box-containing protein
MGAPESVQPTTVEGSSVWRTALGGATGLLTLGALALASRHSYLLFHSLAEMFCVMVASGIFMIAWNARRRLDSGYLLLVGIAYLFIGALDVVHALAYQGMGVFPGYDANLPTQLWVGARYMESVTLLAAPFFVDRRLRAPRILAVYAAVSALFLLDVFVWHGFPACWVEGVGLTPFKKVSEYAICGILFGAAMHLRSKRRFFEGRVYSLFAFSIVATIFSELAFARYASVYDSVNMLGHLLKLISYYLIYKAIIETGLLRPYELVFRSLKRSEEALREERDRARRYLDIAGAILLVLDADGRLVMLNKQGCRVLGCSEEEAVGRDWFDLFVPAEERERARHVFGGLMRGETIGAEHYESSVLTRRGQRCLIEWDNTILTDSGGHPIGTLSSGTDVTERTRAVEALRHSARLNELLLDSIPHPAMLVRKDRVILAANRMARETGAAVGAYCWKDFAHCGYISQEAKAHVDEHGEAPPSGAQCGHCLADRALAEGRPLNHPDLEMFGRTWDTWWVPLNDELYLHYAVDVTARKKMERALRMTHERLEGRVRKRTAELSRANEALREEIGERRRAELALRQHQQKLLTYQEQLRSMATQLLLAEERERRRIASGLHDRIGQSLAVSKLKLGQLAAELPAEAATQLGQVRDLIDETIRDTRTLTFELSPPVLYELGLGAALEWLGERLQQQHGLRVELAGSPRSLKVRGDLGVLLFQTVRELLMNVVKHARASVATVTAELADGHVRISVQDDGVGFSTEALEGQDGERGGFGLFNVREHLGQVGGQLEVDSRPGAGTRASIVVPVQDDLVAGGEQGS